MSQDDLARMIPPEVVEAAAKAILKVWHVHPWELADTFHKDESLKEARAAILAAINAWPGVYANGLQKGWKHYTPALILPLPPQENPDAASK